MYDRMILPRFNYDNILVIAYSPDDIVFIRNNTIGLPKDVKIVEEATHEEAEGKLIIGRFSMSVAARAAECISIEVDEYGDEFLQRFNVVGWER